ncbi:hypothetical protein FS842_002733 [Serendipita sp. 407]|nr:hypothetical protein FS842_002733 [Serendipita sp. 407]
MERAVAAYHSLEANGLHPTVQKVAQEEDVPHTSLGRYLKPGKQKLSHVQELELVKWIKVMADRNLAMTKEVLLEQAQKVYNSTNLEGTLGNGWPELFFIWHADYLSQHWSKPFDKVCAFSATPSIIDNYFKTYKLVVGENSKKIPPHWQFAYDETGTLRGWCL